MIKLKYIITFALAAVALLLLACTANTESDIPLIERQTHALNKAIMCPVCPGESIDQSQNPIAVSMRAIVAEKLTGGWSGDQIKDFFVERYGPSVLLAPPTEGISLAAWIVPPVAVAVAVFAVFMALRWMRRTTPMEAAAMANTPTLSRDDEKTYFERIESALDLDAAPEDANRPS